MSGRRKRGRSFGTIRRLPSGRWQVRYYNQGGIRHTAPRTFPSKADATPHLAQVEAITTMTHLANADAPSEASVDAALRAFDDATRDLPGDRSIANSAATLRHAAADGVAAALAYMMGAHLEPVAARARA